MLDQTKALMLVAMIISGVFPLAMEALQDSVVDRCLLVPFCLILFSNKLPVITAVTMSMNPDPKQTCKLGQD